MKANLGLLYAMGLMSTVLNGSSKDHPSGGNDGSMGHGIPDKPKKVIPNGCKEYSVNGEKIIAISEKSARNKYERKLNKKEKK